MTRHLVFIILLGYFHWVQVKAFPQAKLTVNSSTITETDSVTFHCQTPSHVSVYQCYFYVNGGTQGSYPCMTTFTGSELLLMGKQSSPSVVEVKCFYTVKERTLNIPSTHSDIIDITIGLKPQLSVNFIEGQEAVFMCSLPESVKHKTTCNLYFGESTHPAATIRTSKTSENNWFCHTFIEENELLTHLRLVQQKVFSCDYTLKSDGKSFFSPRSDPYSIPGFLERKLTEISTAPTRFTKTTASFDALLPIQESVIPTTVTAFTTGTTELTKCTTSVSTSTTSDSASGIRTQPSTQSPVEGGEYRTPTKKSSAERMTASDNTVVNSPTTRNHNFKDDNKATSSATSIYAFETSTNKPEENSRMWKLIIAATVSGLIVVVILVVAACLRAKRRTEKKSHKRKQTHITDQSVNMIDNAKLLPADKDGVYSVITSVPAADCPTGPAKSASRKPQTADSDVYHMYCTIPDLPLPSAKDDRMYDLLWKH